MSPEYRYITRLNPRTASAPAVEKCPHCGGTDLEYRPDGATLCKTCFYVTKPRVASSLLQSYAHSIFSFGEAAEGSPDLALGGRIAALSGVLFLAAIVLALLPFSIGGTLWRLLAPTPPSTLALAGGVIVVGILGLLALFTGYTMANGDAKAWRALLPAGVIGLLVCALGPGGVLGLAAGGFAVVAGLLGHVE